MSWRRPSPRSLAGQIVETVRRLIENRVVQSAAALAYYSALSLAPLVIITLGVTGLVVDRGAMQERVAAAVGELVGPQGAELIRTLGDEERRSGSGEWAAGFGVIMLVLSASAVFAQLHDGLNAIWSVEGKPRGGLWLFVRTRLISMTMAVSLGFLLLVSMLVNAFISAMGEGLGRLLGNGAALALPAHLLASLLITAPIFVLLYKLLPDARVAWREAWTAALISAVLFQLGAWGIGLYVGRAGIGSAYGAAGSIVVLLVWVFYTSLIVFAGAQFARVQALAHATPGESPHAGRSGRRAIS